MMIGFDGSPAEGKVAIGAHLAPIFKDHPAAAYNAVLRSERVHGDIRLLRADAGMLPSDEQDIKSETIARQTLLGADRREIPYSFVKSGNILQL